MLDNSKLAFDWVGVQSTTVTALPADVYCATRDDFQARLDKMTQVLLHEHLVPESAIYLITALAGEIGNNSFDHNLGNWPDVPGIFFNYSIDQKIKTIVLADRGQGVLATLKRVKPELANDQMALQTAFTEKLSGRAPENRGNGLKFVRQTAQDQQLHITFQSGTAQAELNDQFIIQPAKANIHGCLAIVTF